MVRDESRYPPTGLLQGGGSCWGFAPGLMLLLGACSSGSAGLDSGVAVETGMDAPHHPDAALTTDETAAGFREATALGLPLPMGIVNTWTSLLMEGDETCPGGNWAQGMLDVYGGEGCRSASGVWYQGAGGGGSEGFDPDGDGRPDGVAYAWKGDATIIDATGARCELGGLTELGIVSDGSGNYSVDALVFGTFGYEAAMDAWFAEGVSASVTLTGTLAADGTSDISITGGFGTGTQAIFLSEFRIGGECGDAPTGTIGFRDDQGYWYDLTFDTTTCDGCGEVVFDGRQSIGVGCADGWEVIPHSFVGIDNAMAQWGLTR